MSTRKLDASEGSLSAWLVIASAIYVVRTMPWAMSELWYDEVITLGDYVSTPTGAGWDMSSATIRSPITHAVIGRVLALGSLY